MQIDLVRIVVTRAELHLRVVTAYSVEFSEFFFPTTLKRSTSMSIYIREVAIFVVWLYFPDI